MISDFFHLGKLSSNESQVHGPVNFLYVGVLIENVDVNYH